MPRRSRTISTDNHCDFIIIGTGAGGGTLPWKLGPSGKRILVIERGGYVPREKDNWNSKAVNAEGKYNTKETWRDVKGKEMHPHTNYYVGGNTKFYGAALFRLRTEDFGEIRHHGGISPEWPVSYDDMEPHYTAAEQLYHVHGEAGEDPTEPWRSAPYPFQAVSHERRIELLSEDFAAQGLRPFHTPLGVMLNESDPRKSACIRCSTCDGFPCLINAKADAQPRVSVLLDLASCASSRCTFSLREKSAGSTGGARTRRRTFFSPSRNPPNCAKAKAKSSSSRENGSRFLWKAGASLHSRMSAAIRAGRSAKGAS